MPPKMIANGCFWMEDRLGDRTIDSQTGRNRLKNDRYWTLSNKRSIAGTGYRLLETWEGEFWISTLARGEGVPTLFEALKPEAQEELVRDHLIEILMVIEKVVPPPSKQQAQSPASF